MARRRSRRSTRYGQMRKIRLALQRSFQSIYRMRKAKKRRRVTGGIRSRGTSVAVGQN